MSFFSGLKRSLLFSISCLFMLILSIPSKAKQTGKDSINQHLRYSISLKAGSVAKITLASKSISNAALIPPVINYPSPETYNLNTAITPLTPSNTGGAVPPPNVGQVTTLTASINAGLNEVTGVVVDGAGNVFAADWGNNLIKEISASGAVSVFAGNGGTAPINGIGTTAGFWAPDALVFDQAGNLFVSDQNNNLIRKITPAGVVSTFAGNGSFGANDGVAILASFNIPRGLAIDNAGNIYVADQGNNLIRKITPAGIVSTIAGNGVFASFNTPTAVGVDPAGNLAVSDAGNNRIVEISTSGAVTIIDGSTSGTNFNFPREIRSDGVGNWYVADSQNNQVKKIAPSGAVTVFAGSGGNGSADGIGAAATFNSPLGLAIDGKGNLYVADLGNNRIRKVSLGGFTIDKALPPGLLFDPTTGIISGTPTSVWPPTNYTVTATNGAGSANTIVNIQVLATLKPSIITFPPIYNSNASVDFSPGATSTNGETPITYTSSNPAVAIITANGLLHIVGIGISYITASQSGDANYSDAQSVTNELIVEENPSLTFPAIPSKTICNADFSAGASSDYPLIPLSYTSSNTAVATIAADGTIHIIAAGTTTITVSQHGGAYVNAPQPVSHLLTVTTGLLPTVTVTANAQSICAGMPVIVTAIAGNDGPNPIYQWMVNGVNAGTNSASLTVNNLKSTDAVTCTVTADDNCKLSTTSAPIQGIIVSPYVTPSILILSSAFAPVCSGTSISFTASTVNQGNSPVYQWSVNGTNAGLNAPYFTSSNLKDGDLVSCMLTNSTGACTTVNTVMSNTLTVHVFAAQNPAASISISASANNVYKGASITFKATALNAVPTVSYQWLVNGIDAGTNSTMFTAANLNNNDVITCILTSGNPCVVTTVSEPIIVSVLPPPTVIVPNAFTPNGDGINDYWDIPDLSYYPACLVKVFTRYGGMVFQSRGYSKPWNGNFNGSKLPVGTYYYVITLNSESNNKTISGYVAVLR